MTWPRTKGIDSSILISALHMAKTTALETYMSMHKVRRKENMNIQGGINSVFRAAKLSKET